MATMFEKRVITKDEARTPHAMLYARGFAVHSGFSSAIPEHWITFVMPGGWRVSWDDRNNLAVGDFGAESIIAIGHAVSPRLESSNLADIVADLGESSCDAEYQSKVDNLAGRFVILRVSRERILVQTDAAGLRPVFFSDFTLPVCIASHAKLVANITAASVGPMGYGAFFKDSGVNSYPGRSTQYEAVKRLTPNTELNAVERTTRRIFPLEGSKDLSVDRAAQELIQYSQLVSKLIQQYSGKIIASLSAGLDSRVTLALNRSVAKDIDFFTYDIQYVPKNDGNRHDRQTAVDIADRFGLKHTVLEVGDQPVPRDVLFALNSNSKATHSRKLAYAYLENLPIDSTHLRSHVYEITRGYYHPFNYNISDFTGENLQYIATAGKNSTSDAVAGFAEYKKDTDFDNIMNYDPLDIFYWEYRSAVIMAAPLLEMDIGHDNFTMINSRDMLRTLLSVPLRSRRDGDVYYAVIKELWPELLDFPINGRPAD